MTTTKQILINLPSTSTIVNSPATQTSFADDINGIYNQLWPLNCRALNPTELKVATESIAKIANKLGKKNGLILNIFNQYLASASVSALIRANSKTRLPLLDRLNELEKSIIKLGNQAYKTCLTSIIKLKKNNDLKDIVAIENTSTILLSFAKTLDPNEVDVNVIDAQGLFDIIANLQVSGILNLSKNVSKKHKKSCSK